MKKNIINKLLVLTLLVFLSGCGKEWLELPLTGVEPFASETLDTEEEVFAVLCASYDMLQAKYLAGAWGSYILISNLAADEGVPVGGGLSDRPEYWDMHEFEVTAENPALLQFWRRNYFGIYRANIVINEISLETPEVEKMKAEAKFLRAYFYFELTRTFGNVAFYTENLSPTEYAIANTDRSEIYAQVETDLLEAIAVLPKKSEQSRADLTRASRGAAQALLGKTYLYQGKYDEAAAIFAVLVNSAEYDLVDVYDSIWIRNEEYGVESVFEIPYASYVHGDAWANGREAEGNIETQLCGTRETPVPGFLRAGWGFDMIDSSLIDAFDAQGDPIRKYATGIGPEFFLANLTLSAGSDLNGNGFPDNRENEGFTGWFQKKRAAWMGYNDPGQSPAEWTWNNNERMIRYSDVLLMYAEALNRKPSPDDALALDMVNMVRDRVELDPISSSGNALFEDIKKERQLELGMEGHRFWDLIRWGDAPEVLGPLGFVEGVNEVYPIPSSEIGLTTLVQNNGY